MTMMPGLTEDAKAYVLGLALQQQQPAAISIGLSLVGSEIVNMILDVEKSLNAVIDQAQSSGQGTSQDGVHDEELYQVMSKALSIVKGRGSKNQAVNLDMLRGAEPVGAAGYSRRALAPEAWTIDNEMSIRYSLTPITWRNTGNERWPSVNAVFLATGDRLIAWAMLQGTRDLFPGDELVETMSITF
jgi:hypothetical protein